MKTFKKGDTVTNKRYAAMGKSFTYVEHHKTARDGDSHEVRNSGGMPDFFGDDAGLYVVNPAPAPFKKGDRVENVNNQPGFIMTVVSDQYTSGAVLVEWPNLVRQTEQAKHLRHAELPKLGAPFPNETRKSDWELNPPAKPRVYLAGGMRGYPEFNFPAFDRAAGILNAAGWDVFNPAAHDRENGFDTKGMTGHEDLAAHGFDLRAALAADLDYITTRASAVAVLPGWEKSSGARAEVATAHALGLPVAPWQAFEAGGHIDDWIIKAATPPSGTIIGDDGKPMRNPFDNGGWHSAGPTKVINDTGRPITIKPLIPQELWDKAVSGEVRTTSSTGGQKGVKPETYSLLPVEALAKVARHYGIGAAKYARNQWRQGYEWSKSFDAAQRHLNAFWSGEDIDEETQSPHMAAVAFHALTLLTFMDEQPDHDDRYQP